MARQYKNLEIYHLSYKFVLNIYKKTESFPKSEIGNITSQLRRAAVSIPLNIAEGSTRNTKKAFLQFLVYSFGSGKEVEVLLNLSLDLNFLNQNDYDELSQQLDRLMAKLFLFMRNLETRVPGKSTIFFQKFKDNSDL